MEDNRLGKGLAALIDSHQIDNSSSAYREKFDINKILPNPFQPRMSIDPQELIGLADSIRGSGIIQPLIVTKDKNSEKYFIIAGERRFRAAQLAGLKYVPIVIKESSPQEMLELAIIENIQRQDLNPIEEAQAFNQLQSEFGLPQLEIAKKVGLNRVTISNKIRLLKLPDPVKEAVLNETISEGHARALLGIRDNDSLIAATDIVIKRGLSVRQTESLVRKINYGRSAKYKRIQTDYPDLLRYGEMLTEKIGYTTNVRRLSKGGRIIIRFMSKSELEDLLKKLGVQDYDKY
ncbi:ParB/RepB/Spo0J family partition protein [Candidatus Dojkabacteria bacterium]|uniref:ParB/RepB/Spo0J family partition protein n=1 Tax=Candidatus Dojkabacteria bacterium TaxID=2099670 RepID=A0A847VD77_9BACT|nr:ParB/RepB/Spo0J family partition protein [Candidatus Dojkabacteria bacterium]